MLKWVKSYQELLGGVAALTAASAVVWTAMVARRNELHDREQIELGALQFAIEKLRRRWVRVSFLMNTEARVDEIRAELQLIHDVAERLPSSAYELAFAMMLPADAIAGYLDDLEYPEIDEASAEFHEVQDQEEAVTPEDDEDCDPLQEIARIVFCVTAFFYGHRRLTDDGTYRHSLRELDDEDISEARDIGLTRDSQDTVTRMFISFPIEEPKTA